jgi:hypothetical protein
MRPKKAFGDLRFFFGVAGAGSSVARCGRFGWKIFRLILCVARRNCERENDRGRADDSVAQIV